MYRFIILIILSTESFAQSNDEETAKWLLNFQSKEQNREKNGNRAIKTNQDEDINLDPGRIIDDTQTDINVMNNTEEPALNLDPDKKILDEYFDMPLSRPRNPENQLDGVSVIGDAPKRTTASDDTELTTSTDTIINCTKKDTGQPGICVRYYLCDSDNGVIIQDGTSIIDIRASDGECQHYLQVCCVLAKIIEEQKVLSESIPEDFSSGRRCGWNNPALNIFQSKNTNNTDDSIYAKYGDFPWMVAIMRNRNDLEDWSNNDYLGGGSLIHPLAVITAAHKVYTYKAEQIKCRAGEWDTQTTYELFKHQDREVMKIVIHEKFFRESLYNNIAVLFLKRPFIASPNINIACVGASLPMPNTMCYSMGWGKDFRKKKEYAVILKKVRLPLVSSMNCQNLLQKTRLGSFFRLHESLTCAGGEEGVDTCKGDGGSPLVCPINTVGENVRYAVFGMVAYGIGCAEKNVPSVYVHIPYLKPWLDATIANEEVLNTIYDY